MDGSYKISTDFINNTNNLSRHERPFETENGFRCVLSPLQVAFHVDASPS